MDLDKRKSRNIENILDTHKQTKQKFTYDFVIPTPKIEVKFNNNSTRKKMKDQQEQTTHQRSKTTILEEFN